MGHASLAAQGLRARDGPRLLPARECARAGESPEFPGPLRASSPLSAASSRVRTTPRPILPAGRDGDAAGTSYRARIVVSALSHSADLPRAAPPGKAGPLRPVGPRARPRVVPRIRVWSACSGWSRLFAKGYPRQARQDAEAITYSRSSHPYTRLRAQRGCIFRARHSAVPEARAEVDELSPLATEHAFASGSVWCRWLRRTLAAKAGRGGQARSGRSHRLSGDRCELWVPDFLRSLPILRVGRLSRRGVDSHEALERVEASCCRCLQADAPLQASCCWHVVPARPRRILLPERRRDRREQGV